MLVGVNPCGSVRSCGTMARSILEKNGLAQLWLDRGLKKYGLAQLWLDRGLKRSECFPKTHKIMVSKLSVDLSRYIAPILNEGNILSLVDDLSGGLIKKPTLI